MYGNQVHTSSELIIMNSVSVNQFRDNLKTYVQQTLSDHEPLKVTRRASDAFIVMGADDWEREQETLYVLQNSSLMQQIAESIQTHASGSSHSSKGYKPTQKQLDEIIDL